MATNSNSRLFQKATPASLGGRMLFPFQCRDAHGALLPVPRGGSRLAQCHKCEALKQFNKCLLADPFKKRAALGLDAPAPTATTKRICGECGCSIDELGIRTQYCAACSAERHREYDRARRAASRAKSRAQKRSRRDLRGNET